MSTFINKNSAPFRAFPLVTFLFFAVLGYMNAQTCGSSFDLKKLQRSNSQEYKEYLRLENLTSTYRQSLAANPNGRLISETGVITIPVVFHVLHRGVNSVSNIPDAEITEQLEILNACYSQNNDQSAVNSNFLALAGNPNFRFELACVDPHGNATTGILRKQTTTVNFVADDENAKLSSLGGDDPWSNDRYLNVWTTPNLNSRATENGFTFLQPLQGYSSFPSAFANRPQDDGVAILHSCIGINSNNPDFREQGKALVHEVAHWLNVRHLFDNGCSSDDGCADTKPQEAPTKSSVNCPVFPLKPNKCGANLNPDGDMYENFMDYTSEDCGLRMFTRDQVTRMRAVFQPGGPRRSFIDNYFKMIKSPLNCSTILYGLRTAFCASMGNINWSVTGSATLASYSGFTYSIASLNAPPSGNAGGIITASWGNFTDAIPYIFGYGIENSTYNPNYYNSSNRSMTVNSVNMTSYNNWTYGQVSFTGATGPAKNWRLASCNSCNTNTYISWSGNNFGIYLTQPYAFATIRAEVPTVCGDKTIEYSFLGGYLNPGYTLSPNPADNEITISASLPIDPNNRTSNSSTPAYEVQIFNAFNQLMKKMKVKKDDRDVTIDVSRFPSNQFYTIKLISDNDVQTKSFFKQ